MSATPEVLKHLMGELVGMAPEGDFKKLTEERDAAAYFVVELPRRYPPSSLFRSDEKPFRLWEAIGRFFLFTGRYHEALPIFSALYEHLLAAQDEADVKLHKGNPLLWMIECYVGLGFRSISKRYVMLTLCEDAVGYHGNIDPQTSGLYFRAVWHHGISDFDLKRYAALAYEQYQKNPKEGRYPEWLLQNLDKHWMDESPSSAEVFVYTTNARYINHLLKGVGDETGKSWEFLCDYILSCMPGCRTQRRVRARSGEYDIICSVNGQDLDFRSELGRYFVCECKDWATPTDFTQMAKFCRILDATKSRFGVLFSTKRITGEKTHTEARNEQMRVYYDRGIVIVCIDISDIRDVAQGANFIRLLRDRYERIRLDQKSETPAGSTEGE